jgi:hypothetical protein
LDEAGLLKDRSDGGDSLSGDAVQALERYLIEAPVDHVRPLGDGAGHPRKRTLILRGGIGLAAKPGDSKQMMVQARREVAAWILALELGLPRLVPATVLRSIPALDSDSLTAAEGSAQILWPLFKPALADGITPELCAADVTWPIAVFDHLIANTDRHEANWGTIDGMPRVVLIDHGHAFASNDSHSWFVDRHREEALPDALLDRIGRFVANRGGSRLPEVLDHAEHEAVFDRAAAIVNNAVLAVR